MTGWGVGMTFLRRAQGGPSAGGSWFDVVQDERALTMMTMMGVGWVHIVIMMANWSRSWQGAIVSWGVKEVRLTREPGESWGCFIGFV